MMKEETSVDLALELFRLTKWFPHPQVRQKTVEGLTRGEVELLLVLKMNLSSQKGAFSASEISSLLQITPAGVTHLLNPLERMRCIERLNDPNDRRVVLVRLTDKGMEMAAAMITDIREQIIDLILYLGEEDSKHLVRLMTKTIDFFTYRTDA